MTRILTLDGTIGTLINVSPVKEVRDAANEASVAMSQYSMSRLVQNDLYTALNEFNGTWRPPWLIPRGSKEAQ